MRPFADNLEVLVVDREKVRAEFMRAYPADSRKAKGEAFRRSFAMIDKPVSPLRQRMIDMTTRRFKEKVQKIRPARQDLRGLPRPVAGHGHERGPSPLSAAHGAAADQRRVHQRRHRRAAVLASA